MDRKNRSQLGLGIILILLGGWFIAQKTVPGLQEWVTQFSVWPFTVIGAGAIILLLALILGAPGLAVPASIVAGIGGILYYQNATQDWGSWSYMWALIPGFVGVGTILTGLLGENTRQNLLLVFSAFLGGWQILGNFGPAILLILLGLWVLGNGIFRSFRQGKQE
jgi:hypothetical protein